MTVVHDGLSRAAPMEGAKPWRTERALRGMLHPFGQGAAAERVTALDARAMPIEQA